MDDSNDESTAYRVQALQVLQAGQQLLCVLVVCVHFVIDVTVTVTVIIIIVIVLVSLGYHAT